MLRLCAAILIHNIRNTITLYEIVVENCRSTIIVIRITGCDIFWRLPTLLSLIQRFKVTPAHMLLATFALTEKISRLDSWLVDHPLWLLMASKRHVIRRCHRLTMILNLRLHLLWTQSGIDIMLLKILIIFSNMAEMVIGVRISFCSHWAKPLTLFIDSGHVMMMLLNGLSQLLMLNSQALSWLLLRRRRDVVLRSVLIIDVGSGILSVRWRLLMLRQVIFMPLTHARVLKITDREWDLIGFWLVGRFSLVDIQVVGEALLVDLSLRLLLVLRGRHCQVELVWCLASDRHLHLRG